MEKDARSLLEKYKRGLCTAAEQALVERWYYQLKDDVKLDEHRIDEIGHELWAKLGHQQLAPKTHRLWPRIAVVAASVAAITLGVWFFSAHYMNGRHAEFSSGSPLARDIAPGKQGATLTLANGEKIRLTDAANGEIAKQAGISVTKTADGQLVYEIKQSTAESNKINTLTTAKGETYILTLPDKSKVWLNAASSLTYTAALNVHGVRRVKLAGEAYFEIAKDKLHPFIVESSAQQVEVLGTHFNINAYEDEPVIKTTLLEGSVKIAVLDTRGISSDPAQKSKVIKPGQQSIFLTKNGNILVETADTDQALDWRNGDFIFKDEPIESVMRKLSRWYNIEVVYLGEKPHDRFNGEISRFKNISKVLELLQQTKGVHFKIEERRVIVSK